MAGSGRKQSDETLILHLAAGASRTSAAKAAGVSERTVFRRLQDPAFRQRLDEARAEMLTSAVARLTASATSAAMTLHRLLTAESESVQLGAARSILELGTKLRESEELAARIAALEAHLEPADNPAGRDRARWSA